MGHKRIAGMVSEVSQFGAAMLRVDMYGEGEEPDYSEVEGA